MKKIEIVTHHLPGYGSPEEWHSRVICDNKLLEEFTSYTQFELGSQTTIYRQKWDKIFKADRFQELVDKALLASPLCDVCGSNTLDGGSSCVNMYFCNKCSTDGTLDKYRQEYKDKQAQYKIDQDKKDKEQEEARHQEALSAMNCFYWRDNLFFKRLDDGSVQITKIEPNKYDHETQQSTRYEMIRHQYIIPPNEWASIIASVSLCGETSEKYYSAVDFHANK